MTVPQHVRVFLRDGTTITELATRPFQRARQPQVGDCWTQPDGSSLVVKDRSTRVITGWVESVTCERRAPAQP